MDIMIPQPFSFVNRVVHIAQTLDKTEEIRYTWTSARLRRGGGFCLLRGLDEEEKTMKNLLIFVLGMCAGWFAREMVAERIAPAEPRPPCFGLSGTAEERCLDAEKRRLDMERFTEAQQDMDTEPDEGVGQEARDVLARLRTEQPQTVTHYSRSVGTIGMPAETAAPAAEPPSPAAVQAPVCSNPDADWSACTDRPDNITKQGDCEWHATHGQCPVHTGWSWMNQQEPETATAASPFNGIGSGALPQHTAAAPEPSRADDDSIVSDGRYQNADGCRRLGTRTIRAGQSLYTHVGLKMPLRVRGSSLNCTLACNSWNADEADGNNPQIGSTVHICGLSRLAQQ